jgi:conjugative relaxase-like TrwC/TraI family protein
MLRITVNTNAQSAKEYYTASLARNDYYTKGGELEIVGQWHGRGSALLGLAGDVSRDTYFALCDNRHPDTGEQLTPRMKEGRRVGYDLTFSASKSVSVLYALSGDSRILDAFQASVQDTMRQIERDMQTRVRQGGESTDRTTGNMVWADFTHFTARPVEAPPIWICIAIMWPLTRPGMKKSSGGKPGNSTICISTARIMTRPSRRGWRRE